MRYLKDDQNVHKIIDGNSKVHKIIQLKDVSTYQKGLIKALHAIKTQMQADERKDELKDLKSYQGSFRDSLCANFNSMAQRKGIALKLNGYVDQNWIRIYRNAKTFQSQLNSAKSHNNNSDCTIQTSATNEIATKIVEITNATTFKQRIDLISECVTKYPALLNPKSNTLSKADAATILFHGVVTMFNEAVSTVETELNDVIDNINDKDRGIKFLEDKGRLKATGLDFIPPDNPEIANKAENFLKDYKKLLDTADGLVENMYTSISTKTPAQTSAQSHEDGAKVIVERTAKLANSAAEFAHGFVKGCRAYFGDFGNMGGTGEACLLIVSPIALPIFALFFGFKGIYESQNVQMQFGELKETLSSVDEEILKLRGLTEDLKQSCCGVRGSVER